MNNEFDNNKIIEFDSVRINAEHDAVWEKEKKDKLSYLDEFKSIVREQSRSISAQQRLGATLNWLFFPTDTLKLNKQEADLWLKENPFILEEWL